MTPEMPLGVIYVAGFRCADVQKIFKSGAVFVMVCNRTDRQQDTRAHPLLLQ
jgi:hypothetical protein